MLNQDTTHHFHQVSLDEVTHPRVALIRPKVMNYSPWSLAIGFFAGALVGSFYMALNQRAKSMAVGTSTNIAPPIDPRGFRSPHSHSIRDIPLGT